MCVVSDETAAFRNVGKEQGSRFFRLHAHSRADGRTGVMLDDAIEHRRARRLFGRLHRNSHHETPSINSSEDEHGYFWHVTDWHVNEYQPANPNPCDMCRSAAATSACKLSPTGVFGHRDCDPAPSFWKEALAFMQREGPSPDFIFAGGDWIGRVPAAHQGASAVRSAALLLATLLQGAFPTTPVMHALGNHDTHPYYSRAAAWRDWEAAWRSEPLLGDAYVQRVLPNAESLATWRRGGYYARPLWPRPQQYPSHGLEAAVRMDAIEALPQSSSSTLWGLTLNTNDLALPGGGDQQLAWLSKALGAIRSRGDSAILLGHIPPGPSHFELDSICSPGHYYQVAGGACWDARSQKRLLHLLAKYSDVLPASYWGHHHTDSVRIVGDDALRGGGRSAAVVEGGSREPAVARHLCLLSPSLTPRNPPHDPAIRLYRYSRRTGAPIDFTEYRLDIDKANANGYAEWQRAPSALHTPPLNLNNMSAAEWARALRGMLNHDHRPTSTDELQPTDPFLKWVSAERCEREAYVESGSKMVPKLRKCKLAHLCAALHVQDASYAECIGHRL